LKLAALIERPEGQSLAEAVRDVNSRILQAVTAEQREIFTSSVLDDYLLDAERDARRRAAAVAARDDPSVESFLPVRGDGIVLSASDIDTYRTCPLKYKFARVFRIPQEPTVHQRFGIVVHHVLERFHAGSGVPGVSGGSGVSGFGSGSLPELLGLLEASWRRGGFGDSEEERQLRGKAAAALTQYHARFQFSESEPLWFERAFAFKLGPHLLRGRVDRVDRLPGGEYELIDYKTGRPKSPGQLVEDVQLSLYAVGAREAWRLDSSQQAYYYVLDDQKVAVPDDRGDRYEWIQEVAMEVADGILSQGFEPTPSFAACSVCDYRLICPAADELSDETGPLPSGDSIARDLQRFLRQRGDDAGGVGVVVAALAQEALEIAGDRVARRKWSGLVAQLVGRRLFEALDERLDIGVALHGEVDLAVVVGGGRFEVARVDRDLHQALQLADQGERRLWVGGGGDVVRYGRPQAGRRHS